MFQNANEQKLFLHFMILKKQHTGITKSGFGVSAEVKVYELYLIMIRCGVERRTSARQKDISTCFARLMARLKKQKKKTSNTRQKKFLFQSHSNFHFFSLCYFVDLLTFCLHMAQKLCVVD